ncbi:unnamed protein product [Paramecium sonneborni]|uniref:Uncharacterized protein n=1 Tax=Paramecium sonneborni TaxID=65129 RepID=A0A8S1KQE3_9CILI|nr:unnamed protein product [Paramecium sonneborni]
MIQNLDQTKAEIPEKELNKLLIKFLKSKFIVQAFLQ